MKRLHRLVACSVLACLVAQAAYGLRGGNEAPPDLDTWLQLQRRVYAAATVSGSFYDWRAVSRYRAQAGLHLGYDIAMPPGIPVVTGWSGQVTTVAPWSGAEHGITLMSPSGYVVTFGHLRPRVRVGDVLNVGDTVGTVVIDHVDIKMRGPDGAYFDWGHSRPGIASFPGVPTDIAPPFTIEQRLLAFHGEAWVRGRIASARQEVERRRIDTRTAQQQFEDGVLSRDEAEEPQVRLKQARARLAWLEQVLRRLREDGTLRRARAGTAPQKPAEALLQRAVQTLVPLPRAGERPAVPENVETLFEAGALSRSEHAQARRTRGGDAVGEGR